MQGVEGQIFGPMSRTYAYALLGAVIATFTVTPVLSSILLPAQVSEVETFLVRQIRRVYEVVLPRAVRRYRRCGGDRARRSSCVCGVLGARLGTEFLPKLEEGNCGSARCCRRRSRSKPAMETVARIRNIIRSYRAGAHRRLRAGPRRGRDRSRRLVRRRILRAAEAVRRMAEGPDQGRSWSSR